MKKCAKCGSEYNDALDACPVCIQEAKTRNTWAGGITFALIAVLVVIAYRACSISV